MFRDDSSLSTRPVREDSRLAVRRITRIGLVVNIVLVAAKGGVGIVTGSQALVADAIHSLSDSVTDIVVLFGLEYWSAPADDSHPHGHGRIETLITVIIGLALALAAVGLGYRAIVSLPDHDPAGGPGWAAFAIAVISIISKEVLYRGTVAVAERVKSGALMANAWHHRSDAFSSVPVAAAVLGVRLAPGYGFLDHLAAIIVSVLLLRAAWGIAYPALRQLVDAGADAAACERLRRAAGEVPRVSEVHRLRTRHIGPGLQVDLHVLVDPEMTVRDGHAIGDLVRDRLLSTGIDVVDVLVHVEPYEDREKQAPG